MFVVAYLVVYYTLLNITQLEPWSNTCVSPLSLFLSLSIFPFPLICNKKLRVREMESFKREKVKERWRKGEREGNL